MKKINFFQNSFFKSAVLTFWLLLVAAVGLRAQNCTESSPASGFDSEGYSKIGQSFTSACTGDLMSITFQLAASVPFPVLVSVSTANSDGCALALLGTAVTNGNAVAGDNTVFFGNPLSLNQNTYYVFMLQPVLSGFPIDQVVFGVDGYVAGNLVGVPSDPLKSSDACLSFPAFDLNFSVQIVSCTPIGYAVTGGGGFCPPATGKVVGLSSSQSGVNYQLKKDGVNTGTPVAGTGTAFDFPGLQDAGVYTVVATATANGCTANMAGSQTVTQNPTVTSITASNLTACNGNGTTCTTDDTYQMQVQVIVSALTNGTFALVSPDLVPPMTPFPHLLDMTFIGLNFKATGAPVSLTGDLSDPNACDLTIANAAIAPASCSVQDCSISNLEALLIEACNNNGTTTASDDFFKMNIYVDFNYAPPTGNLVIKRGNTVVASVPSGSLSCVKNYVFQNVSLTANGQPLVLTAEFTGGNCSFTNSNLGNAPAVCSCFLQNSFATVQPKCFGGSNGSIMTTTTQANLPCTYSWLLPSGATKTTRNLSNLKAGQYFLTTTDNAGCTLTNNVTVGQPGAIAATATTTSTTATINVTGGTPPYQYNRSGSPFQTSNVFTGLLPNYSYNFRVRDANNCQKVISAKTKPGGGNAGQATDRFEIENRSENQFEIFPNPADNFLKIIFLTDETVAGWVEIFNQLGQRVLTQNLKIEPGEESVLQVEHLPQGSYFLNFRNENGSTACERFLKN